MILGDGYLQKTGQKNARLRLEHRADHREYMVWKASLLPQLFQGRPSFLKRNHPLTKRTYSYVRFQSHSSPVLGKLRSKFYPDGAKKIPKDLKKFLKDDIALAIWYMDDGYYYARDKCAYIYLGTVTLEEAKIASESIYEIYRIHNRVLDKKNKGFALYFSPSDVPHLMTRIQRYIVPIMQYKKPS